jgi:outer membrane protein TolC
MLFRRGVPNPVLLVLLLLPLALQAQQRIPLTLGEAERLALEQEPGLLALHERALALGEESVAARQLPDPQLRVALANYPIESGGFSTEGMTQAQIGYRQAFSSGDFRESATRRYESLAESAMQSAAARERSLRMQTRQAWLELYYWERAREIVVASRPFFEDLVAVTTSLYSVGRKSQYDVLRAELELARLDDRLIEIGRRYGQARSALSRWIGDAAARPLAQAIPDWEPVPSLETLHANLASHPSIAAADAQVAAEDANVVRANESKTPGWVLDVGYGYREGYLPSGEPRSDFISIGVTVDLPLFGENRQERAVAAALRERTAARYDKAELIRELSSQLDIEYQHWQDLTRRLALFDSQILDIAAGQADAALLAYQADTGDFSDVMRSSIDDLTTRLDYVRLQVERGQSHAALANLGGLSP